ncbi:Transcription factor Nrm1/Whi5 [Kalmanozyma brasiliensis GHG001]|nr:Transcription factor Nrm1/Whi5 [Kalmanozyma brasiliensis GHG001]EST04601.2 Transcription factor Nrm1/Whi5 [Kalmanozyma brasiliensis GHG001]
MASQASAPVSTAAGSSQSYLLAPLQSSASSNVPITPSKARKQAQAQRTRLVALSKHLMTRLQYANFKVEHGWSKQSLPEVENLYYRQNQSGTSTATATGARKSASTSPNNKAPVTPSVAAAQAQLALGSRLFKDAAVKKTDAEGGDVFGGYGLATPPASAGSIPGATSYLTSKRGRSASSTPISPPNTSTNSSASKAGEAQKRSPNNKATAGGATSYADFWSRVGSSTATSAGAGRSSISPSKKRSADEVVADAPKASESGTATSSPHKRVRMESDPERAASSSPAKTTLADRGPSFASSVRKH